MSRGAASGKTLTLDQVERMKTLYVFDCDGGIARYRSDGRIVDTRTGDNRDYIGLGWTKSYKLWKDGDVSSPRLHRVLYTITHGEIEPGMVIDHIDGTLNDSGLLNNSITNLRLTTPAGNNRNVSTNTGLNFIIYNKSNNTYKLQLLINNSDRQQICNLSSNKFTLTDMQHIRNHLVHKLNIDISTCPPDQDWSLPTSEQLTSIVNRTGPKCKLRKYM